ncbi:hypothetical protein F5050DRAFT_1716192 [Lentinula boryana]|uniref:Uncharacterized protein n=1 Tax=Lentinula boryana TaxID=40481 RepID=A0ABQ8PY15_9AGAR|nr:hypothetical protein F5050DRAFT_1716192 [Lentinula boryana]
MYIPTKFISLTDPIPDRAYTPIIDHDAVSKLYEFVGAWNPRLDSGGIPTHEVEKLGPNFVAASTHFLCNRNLLGIPIQVDIVGGPYDTLKTKTGERYVIPTPTANGHILLQVDQPKIKVGNVFLDATTILKHRDRPKPSTEKRLMVVIGGVQEHIGKLVWRIHHFFKGSKSNANKWFKLVVVEFSGEVERVTDLELELLPNDVEYVRESDEGSKRKHSTADDDNEKDVNDPSDSTNNPPKGQTTRRQLKKKHANTLELDEQDLLASYSHLIERTTPCNPSKLPPGDPPSSENSATTPRNPPKLPPAIDPPSPASPENNATTPRNPLKLPPIDTPSPASPENNATTPRNPLKLPPIDPPSPASPENNATTPCNPSKLPPIDPPSPASPENNAMTPRNPSKLPPIDPPSLASPENNATTPHNPSKLPPNTLRHLNRKQASPDIHAEPYKMFLGGQDPLRCNLETEALAFLPYHPRDEEEDKDRTPLFPEEIEEEELRTFKRDSDNPDNGRASEEGLKGLKLPMSGPKLRYSVRSGQCIGRRILGTIGTRRDRMVRKAHRSEANLDLSIRMDPHYAEWFWNGFGQ